MVERPDRAAPRPRETAAQRELAIRADLAQIRSDDRGVTEVEGGGGPHGKRARLHAHQLAQSRHHAAPGLEERAAERGRGGRRDVEGIGSRSEQEETIGEAEHRGRARTRQRASRADVDQRGTGHQDRAVHRVEECAGEGERSPVEARHRLRDHDAAVEGDKGARGAAGESAFHLEHVASEAERAVRGPEEIGGEGGHRGRSDLIEIARNAGGLVGIGEERRRSAGVARAARHRRGDRRLTRIARGAGGRFARVRRLVTASREDAGEGGRARELTRGQRRHDARVLG